jgi:hypothetical protein
MTMSLSDFHFQKSDYLFLEDSVGDIELFSEQKKQ